jgi:FAD:protein FMN transferase
MILEVKMKIIACLSVVFLFTACNVNTYNNYRYFRIAGHTQGTTYHITYKIADSVNLQPKVDSLLHAFDLSLSTYDTSSIISKINRNKKNVEADNRFAEVFVKANEVYLETNGSFDITVGPLVDVWGFGRAEKKHEPDQEIIDSILAFVGMDKVALENNIVVKQDPRISLDVNAIAQGYAVDVVSAFLDGLKIGDYLVEIGGEVRTKGVNPKGEIWRIGVDKPEDDNHLPGQVMQAIVQLPNWSLATSGNYRKFFVENGEKYAHSINPKTGRPVKHQLLSATIFSKDCMTADAYATACMVLGLEKAKKLVNEINSIEAYFIYSDKHGLFHTWQTKGVEKLLVEEF